MVSFVIDENHLRQLSPEARSELLNLIGAELADVEREYAGAEWDPEENTSYPLSAEEALALVRGLDARAKRLLRTFCLNYDGKVGSSDLDEMLSVTGIEGYDDLGQEISAITHRMHSATGNPDAWLFNWHARDWLWDEEKKTYAQGRYFISGPAISSLRKAFGIGQNGS